MIHDTVLEPYCTNLHSIRVGRHADDACLVGMQIGQKRRPSIILTCIVCPCLTSSRLFGEQHPLQGRQKDCSNYTK